MAGAIFSRLKNWGAENLTNEDLNNEIDNILNNFLPLQFDDYSVNVAQMQNTTDPGESGTESLATTLAGELERLRFVLAEIKGGSLAWYESSSTSLSELASAIGGGIPDNRISSGKTRTNSSAPDFLVPVGAGLTVDIDGTPSNFVYSIKSISYTISTDVTSPTLLAAPGTNNTALVNDTTAGDEEHTKLLGEYDTKLYIDTVGSEITTLNGNIAAFKINNGIDDEYFLAEVDTTNGYLHKCRRGYFFDSSRNPIDRITIANNDTITLMKLTWLFVTSAGAIAPVYTNPTVTTDEPSSPNTGDYWFDLDPTENKWKTFNGAVWADADATLIGLSIQDDTNCIGVRPYDFFKSYSAQNTMYAEVESATRARSVNRSASISVYGQTLRYGPREIDWDMPGDLDSGVSEAASTHFYLYISDVGDVIISDVAPYDRRNDISGYYHPYEAYRCIAQVFNDSSQDFSGIINFENETIFDPTAFSVLESIAASAYTLTLSNQFGDIPTPIFPLNFSFRNATVTSGQYEAAKVFGSVALIVVSGATMGFVSSKLHSLFFYLIRATTNVDSYEIMATSLPRAESELQTTIAMSTASDTEGMYSTTVLSNKNIIPIARCDFSLTTAGTWTAADLIVKYDKNLNDFIPDVFLNYENSNAQAFPSTTLKILDLNAKVKHSSSIGGNVTTGSSWQVVIPFGGYYAISFAVAFSTTAQIFNDFAIRVNGTSEHRVTWTIQVTGSQSKSITSSATRFLSTGDVVNIYGQQIGVASINVLTGAPTYITLARIPGPVLLA